jgi:hypothetical protein
VRRRARALTPPPAKTQWLGILALLLMLLVVDCLFLGEDTFVFDPDYKNWARKTETKL